MPNKSYIDAFDPEKKKAKDMLEETAYVFRLCPVYEDK
jgi:hypothetical protein